ncbi:MAG: tetratricopeptide repeat protein, partial [Calditrichaeota bacterium]|nr:tetratricopeptide repeat protein [Calditrichota bacterium]
MTGNRRLAAIAFSDIKNFTKRMAHNEDLMMRLLQEHNHIFMVSTKAFHGRIVKSTGDGFLFEFPSATDAVKCCLYIQGALKKLSDEQSDEEPLLVRIGIHLGEVIERGQDIFGSDVNIASRLEPFSEPGGICISSDVNNSIKSSLHIETNSIGIEELKHVDVPMELFHIPVNRGVIEAAVGDIEIESAHIPDSTAFYGESSKRKGLSKDDQQKNIAVLPFKLYSARTDDVYLSEGFSESLIFGISKEKQLNVQPLQAVLDLGSDAEDLDKLADILGVGFVVMGTLQRAGSKLKIQLNMLRTSDGKRLYSEEMIGSEDDIFDLQNRVIKSILFSIMRRVSGEIEASLSASSPKNPMAGSLYLKGKYQLRSASSWDEYKKGISLLEAAVSLDKNFTLARSALSKAYTQVHGNWQSDRIWLEKGAQEAEAAARIAPDMFEAVEAQGIVSLYLNQLDDAETKLIRAISLIHETISARTALSQVYIRQGKLDEARVVLDEALHISTESGDRLSGVKLLIRLAGLDRLQGFYLIAIERYGTALSLTKDSSNSDLEIGIRQNIGNVYSNMGKISLAISNYKQALEIIRKLRTKKHLATLLSNLGSAFEANGEMDKSLSIFKDGLNEATKTGDSYTVAAILFNMSHVQRNMGNSEEAIETIQKAIFIHEESGNIISKARALIDLAAYYCDLGRHNEALETYSETQDLLTETGDYPMLASTLVNIGEIYEMRGETEQALNYYSEAEDVFNRFDANQYRPYLNLFRGRLYFQNRIYN